MPKSPRHPISTPIPELQGIATIAAPEPVYSAIRAAYDWLHESGWEGNTDVEQAVLQFAKSRAAEPVHSDAVMAEEAARSALFDTEMARTEVVNPVNGSAPYSYVMFHGQRIELYDDEWTIQQHRDAGSAKAAAYATKINDALFALAKKAASIAVAHQSNPAPDNALVEALRPFARIADHCANEPDETVLYAHHMLMGDLRLTIGHFRNAAAALTPAAVEHDDLKAMLINAYESGCQDVHENYQEDRDPDFTEAAHDYANHVLAAVAMPAAAEEKEP